MDMEWISQLSMPGFSRIMGRCFRAATHAAKAWPASCVSTSTSSDVPLKLEKMKGAL